MPDCDRSHDNHLNKHKILKASEIIADLVIIICDPCLHIYLWIDVRLVHHVKD